MGSEINNMKHKVDTCILSGQLNTKYNTRDNVINRKKVKPKVGQACEITSMPKECWQ